MNNIEFSDVLWFVNSVGNLTLKEEEKVKVAQGCYLYKGTVDGSGINIDIDILYLDKAAVVKDYATALRSMRQNVVRQLVVANQLESKLSQIGNYFENHVKSIHTTTTYLYSIIESDTRRYNETVSKYETELYVAPLVNTTSEKHKNHDNPIRAWLEDIDLDKQGNQVGSIGVLLAEPGQGKTFTAQCISSQLAKAKRILPVYIQSTQWKTLDRLDATNLSKVIAHSFTCHHAPLPWIEGMEEKFISLFLRIGLLRIIFDGFDEYIYWNRGDMKPVEVLNTLWTLAKETESKILVTCRTSFWETEISPQNGFHSNDGIVRFELLAFSRDMSKEYFKRWFGTDEDKKRRANRVIDELNVRYERDVSKNLAGRGFILYLIADLIDRTNIENAMELGGKPALDWLFQELCARECTRQNLSLSDVNQMSVFKNLCEFMPKGFASRQGLETAIELVDDTLSADLIERNAQLMENHPLIRSVDNDLTGDERWVFMHEQVYMAILVNHILEDFLIPEKGRRSHIRITACLKHIDYWESAVHAMYDAIRQTPGNTDFTARIKEYISRFMTLADAFPEAIIERYLATALALLSTDSECGRDDCPARRTEVFLSYFQSDGFSGQYFSGPVHHFDFTNRTLLKCQFDTVTFIRCNFDNTSIFEQCKFTKVNHYGCPEFATAHIDKSNTVDKLTRRLIMSGRITDGIISYDQTLIHNDIINALNVLASHHRSGYRKLTEWELKKSIVAPDEIEDEFIKIFAKHTLVPQRRNAWHHSNVFSLKSEIDIALRQYIESGALTGALAECEQSLLDMLRSDEVVDTMD